MLLKLLQFINNNNNTNRIGADTNNTSAAATMPSPDHTTPTAVNFTTTLSGGGHVQQGNTLTINNHHHAPITTTVNINKSQSSSIRGDASSMEQQQGLVHNTNESQEEQDLYNTDTDGRLDPFPPGLLPKKAKTITEEHVKKFWGCYKHFHGHPVCLQEIKELVKQKGLDGVQISHSPERIKNYIDILKDLISRLALKGHDIFVKECCLALTNNGVKVKETGQGPQHLDDIKSIIASESAKRLQKANNLFMPGLMHACVFSLSAQKGNSFYTKFLAELQKYCKKTYCCPFNFEDTIENTKISEKTGEKSRKNTVEHPIMSIAKSRITDVHSAVRKSMMDAHGISSMIQAQTRDCDDDVRIIPIDKLSFSLTNMGGMKKKIKAKKDTKKSGKEGESSDHKEVVAKYVKVRRSNFGGASEEEIQTLLGKSEKAIAYYLLAKTALARGVGRDEYLKEAGHAFDFVEGLVGKAPTNIDPDWNFGGGSGDELDMMAASIASPAKEGDGLLGGVPYSPPEDSWSPLAVSYGNGPKKMTIPRDARGEKGRPLGPTDLVPTHQRHHFQNNMALQRQGYWNGGIPHGPPPPLPQANVNVPQVMNQTVGIIPGGQDGRLLPGAPQAPPHPGTIPAQKVGEGGQLPAAQLAAAPQGWPQGQKGKVPHPGRQAAPHKGIGESEAGGQLVQDASQRSSRDQGKPRTWYSHFHDNMRVSQGHAHRHPRKPHAPIHVDAFLCPHCESVFFSSEQARQAHITGDCADAPQAQGGGAPQVGVVATTGQMHQGRQLAPCRNCGRSFSHPQEYTNHLPQCSAVNTLAAAAAIALADEMANTGTNEKHDVGDIGEPAASAAGSVLDPPTDPPTDEREHVSGCACTIHFCFIFMTLSHFVSLDISGGE